MAKYPNTLGLLVASELINDETTLSATPVIKATVHALKKYMKLRNDATGQRVLPIGYNAAMSSARDRTVLDYLSSGGGESSIDFWTCKNYSWIGESSKAHSGYDDLVKQLDHAVIPIFLSEYGHPKHQPRLFQETVALYSPSMSRIFSGGCLYEFWQSSNGYGFVEMLGKETDTRLAAYQQAPDDRNKVKERRETKQGVLLVYHDFANHKRNLAEVEEVEADLGHTLTQQRGQERWPWEPEYNQPESCVDWGRLESL